MQSLNMLASKLLVLIAKDKQGIKEISKHSCLLQIRTYDDILSSHIKDETNKEPNV